MRVKLDVECPECSKKLTIEYRRLGSITQCPACLRDVEPKVPVGGTIPVHQWELTFRDFRNLVEDPSYRRAIASRMKEWFDYRIVGDGMNTRIVDANSEAVDPLGLHLRIQDDSRFQYELYQVAQSLWR
jgi:hypothetical protein